MASEDEHEAVSGEEKEEVPVITLLIYCNKLYISFLSLQYSRYCSYRYRWFGTKNLPVLTQSFYCFKSYQKYGTESAFHDNV